MLFIRLCRPKNESAMTREEIERKMDELARVTSSPITPAPISYGIVMIFLTFRFVK
jgi:hypothetical protein